VTSPGKSMVAGASKGRGIGRGNFYEQNTAVLGQDQNTSTRSQSVSFRHSHMCSDAFRGFVGSQTTESNFFSLRSPALHQERTMQWVTSR